MTENPVVEPTSHRDTVLNSAWPAFAAVTVANGDAVPETPVGTLDSVWTAQ
jgi:hypothetical protein